MVGSYFRVWASISTLLSSMRFSIVAISAGTSDNRWSLSARRIWLAELRIWPRNLMLGSQLVAISWVAAFTVPRRLMATPVTTRVISSIAAKARPRRVAIFMVRDSVTCVLLERLVFGAPA